MKSFCLLAFLLATFWSADSAIPKGAYTEWSLEQAIGLLNESSWARQETFTKVLGGVGSGIQGEKEIYSTFFVRLLSAEPVRQAFARIRQIHMGYDELSEEEKKRVDLAISDDLNLDMGQWIVVSVAFRSNIPSQEAQFTQHFQSQTLETLNTEAYLSTPNFQRLELVAYYPPKEKSVGAKFVFPRRRNREPVLRPEDDTVVFELDVPSMSSDLRVVFSVADMLVEGELLY
jgi:hypothetical protein